MTIPAAAWTSGSIDHRGDPLVLFCQQRLQLPQVVLQQPFVAATRPRAAGTWSGAGTRSTSNNSGSEHGVEPLDAADADAAQRVAVVGVAQGHVAGLLGPRVGPLLPVLKGHLQRHLDGRGPVVGEEDVLQARRGQVDQPLGQLDRGRVATCPAT